MQQSAWSSAGGSRFFNYFSTRRQADVYVFVVLMGPRLKFLDFRQFLTLACCTLLPNRPPQTHPKCCRRACEGTRSQSCGRVGRSTVFVHVVDCRTAAASSCRRGRHSSTGRRAYNKQEMARQGVESCQLEG